MASNVDEFLYNFMHRMFWILQSIFLYLGGRLGVGELNTDVYCGVRHTGPFKQFTDLFLCFCI